MGAARIINNIGIGKVEATFMNLTTTGSSATRLAFTNTMLDDFDVAAALLGNNEIGYLTTTYPVFGAVVALSANDHPAIAGVSEKAAVQLSGVASIQGTTAAGATPAVNRLRRVVGINGMAGLDTTTVTKMNIFSRGVAINVWDTDRVDVLFD